MQLVLSVVSAAAVWLLHGVEYCSCRITTYCSQVSFDDDKAVAFCAFATICESQVVMQCL